MEPINTYEGRKQQAVSKVKVMEDGEDVTIGLEKEELMRRSLGLSFLSPIQKDTTWRMTVPLLLLATLDCMSEIDTIL